MNNNINRLCKEKNAIILAHFYQKPEIQDIAHFVGDSLALARQAQKANADIIIFAGVHFMAETAKILNPTKKVLIPDMNAACSLADSCPEKKFKSFVEKHPDHLVLSYINASAKIKTMSDIIVTSSNAKKIVEQLPENQKIIFAPDKNLGSYINYTTGRNMLLWDGACHVHSQLKAEKIIEIKSKNPDAILLAHPECQAPVLEIADFVGSTNDMLNYSFKSLAKKFIVATESGILHQMKMKCPEKEFIIIPANDACSCNDCEYMKLNTLEKIEQILINETNEILLDEETIKQSQKPLLRMLEMS